jgi:hypothetical protein
MSTLQQILAWDAIIGCCAWLILGFRRWVILWLILPYVLQLILIWAVEQTTLELPAINLWWALVPLCIAAPFVVLVIGLRLWTTILKALFGPAGIHAAGIDIHAATGWLFGRRRGRPIPMRKERDDV